MYNDPFLDLNLNKEVKIIKNKKKKGFTLIELIAVIAILGVLAAVLVPNITGYMNKSKIAKVKSDAKLCLDVINASRAGSSAPGTILNYTTAITNNGTTMGDPTLALSRTPIGAMSSLTDVQLQAIISSTVTDYNTTTPIDTSTSPDTTLKGYQNYYQQ